MEEKKINETESIEIISAMISRTKERLVRGGGNILLMWGYLTVCVTIIIWALLLVTHNPVYNWLWFLIWIVGGTATPIMARKQQLKEGVKSYSDKISSKIWGVVGFSTIFATFCCLGLLLFGGIDAWAMMFAIALVIVPFAEIAQGIVIRERSLMAGGAVGLAIGIFTLACIAGRVPLRADWFMPLFIVAFAGMMIVPGHILNHKAKNSSL